MVYQLYINKAVVLIFCFFSITEKSHICTLPSKGLVLLLDIIHYCFGKSLTFSARQPAKLPDNGSKVVIHQVVDER